MNLIKKLFWEYDYELIKNNLSNIIVIERILEFGTKEQFDFLVKNIGISKIDNYLLSTGKRRLSKKSYNFWREYLEIIGNS